MELKAKDVIAALERRWGKTVSRSRISQLKKRGMPMDQGVDAALDWIESHAQRGICTHAGSRKTPSSSPAALPGQSQAPASTTPAPNFEPTIAGLRETAIANVKAAHEALHHAQAVGHTANLPNLQRQLSAAIAIRLKVEDAWREDCKERGVTLDASTARRLLHGVIDPLADALRALPRTVAAAANPVNPVLALEAIETEIERILSNVAERLPAQAEELEAPALTN